MFERRLKVFLGVLLVVTLALVLRAAQVQVVQHGYWKKEAADARTRSSYVDTTRGAIRDRRGNVIAVDEPCVDICVDYRALTRELNRDWLEKVAGDRLRVGLGRHGPEYLRAADTARRSQLLRAEIEAVREDVRTMWGRLARVADLPRAEIDDARQAILEKVRMRQRSVWYRKYEVAVERAKAAATQPDTRPAAAWHDWLLDDSDMPELDKFWLTVEEQTQKHVLIRDVSHGVQVALTKTLEQYPGLELRPSTARVYPHGSAAAHVIGRVAKVTADDRKFDPNKNDPLRRYEPNDLKGRGGLEELCDAILRGARGRIHKLDGREVGSTPREVGRDVYASIDIELQADVQALFSNVPIETKLPGQAEPVVENVAMHGAAVVLDVKTGEVLVMASAPSYDLNTYDDLYAFLSSEDNHDTPLINRATQALREPGSTIKPLVGLAGVTESVRRADEGYECTGYMALGTGPSRQFFKKTGRCWVNTMYHDHLCEIVRRGEKCNRHPCPSVAHHPAGGQPHPTGFLSLADALERSCNPYFESIAHELGPDRLTSWYKRFGLGEKTYVGIAESAGRVPIQYKSDPALMYGPMGVALTWSAGIGQGPVHATPLQMANVAATVARDGVWLRPKLLAESKPNNGGRQERPPTTQLADREDLGLSAAGLEAAREGMFRVVNGAAGSGGGVRRTDLAVAGKTGSAQASPFAYKVKDPATGLYVSYMKDGKQRFQWACPEPSTLLKPNPQFPWYRGGGREGKEVTHAWFIGYAPADDPQIAFAVLVEYGGSGGGPAAGVAKGVLDLCVRHKYLVAPVGPLAHKPQEAAAADATPGTQPTTSFASPSAQTWRELLTDLPATRPAGESRNDEPRTTDQ